MKILNLFNGSTYLSPSSLLMSLPSLTRRNKAGSINFRRVFGRIPPERPKRCISARSKEPSLPGLPQDPPGLDLMICPRIASLLRGAISLLMPFVLIFGGEGFCFAVGSTPSSVALTSSPNPSAPAAPVTLTATLNSTTATGTVTFKSNGLTLGTVSSPFNLGVATFSANLGSAGSYTLTADYSGDTTYASSTSNSIIQAVVAGGFGFRHRPKITWSKNAI